MTTFHKMKLRQVFMVMKDMRHNGTAKERLRRLFLLPNLNAVSWWSQRSVECHEA